ncbi:MAG: hypothetical protein MJA29_11535 [Candidatus Omnitrophica bacterium]|nr:hypothetical protein [Candidatus Omnitrophota bacterium]
MTKQIDRPTYLKAMALFHLAQQKQKQVVELQKELAEVLDIDRDDNHLFDGIYEFGSDTSFEEKLKLEQIESELVKA